MAKSKTTAEFKLKLVQEYLDGRGSCKSIARENGIGKATMQKWILKYESQGTEAFLPKEGNKRYSGEFKKKCVEMYLRGEISLEQICAKYAIPDSSVLQRWVEKYNGGKELRDYEPNREVYMAPKRKATKEERIEIVDYCLSHDKDYKNTAALYEVSYSQVYDWVKRFEERGEEGLEDRRGKRREEEELTETERLRRENARLRKQHEKDVMTIELLKKVKELERK